MILQGSLRVTVLMKFPNLHATLACGFSLSATAEVAATREAKRVIIRVGSEEILR